VGKFHSSKEWRKVSKEFKTPRCVDCGKTEDIEAGHILPASRFKMFRLWKSNLVNQCRSCNAKLGNKIRWSLQAIKLLGLYMLVKIVSYTIIATCYFCLFRYAYLDIQYNNSTITNQIKYDFISAYEWAASNHLPPL